VSNSGTTREVLDLLPVVKGLGATVVALTGPKSSPLAREADVAICWGELREADPMGVVPTVSAALTLALGDALTVAVMARRGVGAGHEPAERARALRALERPERGMRRGP